MVDESLLCDRITETFDIDIVRAQFPILKSTVHDKPLVYLDNAATTQKPESVIRAITSFYTETNSNIHRGVHLLSEQASNRYESARRGVQSFINASASEQIVFTGGTTESINLVAHSFGQEFVKEGDEIIVSELEHHSNLVPWQKLCAAKGARLRILPMSKSGVLQCEMLESMTSDKTKLVSVCHVSNTLGGINPLEDVIKTAHARGIPVLVDGAQAVAHLPVDVDALDCDFYVFSGHKMFAATGIGVLYAKDEWLEKMPPYQTGGGMIQSVHPKNTSFAEAPFKFEAGTPNICGAISLDAAITFIQRIDPKAVHAYERDLLHYARGRLVDLDNVTVYGPGENTCGVISFAIDGVSPYDTAVLLDKLGIAVRSGMHCAQPVMDHFEITGTVRASFALYNTKEEVDKLTEGVERVIKILR